MTGRRMHVGKGGRKIDIGKAAREARTIKRTVRNGHRATWFIVRVAAGREFHAETVLGNDGLLCFVPSEAKWRRRHRYATEPEMVRRPLLIRYLFVSFGGEAPDWYRLSRFAFVEAVVGVGGRPLQVPWTQVKPFVEAYNRGSRKPPRAHKHMKINQEFSVGDKVEVYGGPFDRSVVLVQNIVGSTAKVVLELFGSERSVSIGLDKLAAL